MAKKKAKNVIIWIFAIALIVVGVYFSGLFSLITTQDVGLYQYNGNFKEDWEWTKLVSKGKTASFGDISIIQSKNGWARLYGGFECAENNCGGTQTGIDEWGCPLYIAKYNHYYGGDEGRISRRGTVYCETRFNVPSGIRCEDKCGAKIDICKSGLQQSSRFTSGASACCELRVFGDRKCGGRKQTVTKYHSGCFHKFRVTKNGLTVFDMDDKEWSDSREVYNIPTESNGQLVSKLLFKYENKDGFIDCPYVKGETVSSCEQIYGQKVTQRYFLVEESELTILPESQRPIPYPEDGIWGTGASPSQRYTTADKNYIFADFKVASDRQYNDCYRIENQYYFPIPDDSIELTLSSPKDTYIAGESANVDVEIENQYQESLLRLDILYAIPTAFGDKEKEEQYIVDLDEGMNTFAYPIPTEQVVDEVKVTVSGDIVLPGNYFSGVNDKCKSKEDVYGNSLTPAATCDYITIGSFDSETKTIQIRSDTVPQFCLDQGIITLEACDEYIIANINQLNMDIDDKIALIQSLQATRDEKIDIILQLEANVNEQAVIIDEFQLTIEEQIGYIDQLGLTVQEQEQLITQLQLTTQQKQELIASLESEIDQQAMDILALGLTVEEQAAYIEDLNLNIEDQAALINKLTSNLEEKAYFISQLTAENERQAELIAEMEVSFANQGEIVSNLQLTVQEDAEIISQLSNKNDEQGRIIEGMELTLNEQRILIESLTSSNEAAGEIIAQLELTTNEQKVLIESLTKSVDEQVEIIANMKLTNQEQQELIQRLRDKVDEQQEMIDKLNAIIEKERGEFFDMQVYVFVGAAVLVFGGLLYFILRKK
jgi:hypothetical protein